MKFLVSVIDDKTRSPHSPEERKATDDFNDKIVAAEGSKSCNRKVELRPLLG